MLGQSAYAPPGALLFDLVRMYGAVGQGNQRFQLTLSLKIPRAPAKAIYDSIIIPDLLLAEKSPCHGEMLPAALQWAQ